MKPWLLLVCLALASCVQYEDGFGGKYASLGGSATAEFPSGGRLTHSHTRSFQHATQAITTIGLGLASASVNKAKDAADALTSQQANKQTAALAAQKQADSTLIELSKLPK